MRETILNFTSQISRGFDIGKKIQVSGKYPNIYVSAMGGSATAGEMLQMIRPDLNIQINEDYGLTSRATTNDLIICVSWSGETKETIDAYHDAVERGCSVIVITKGGLLYEMVVKQGIPFAKMPEENIPARFGVGYMLGALAGILNITDIYQNIAVSELEIKGREIASDINAKIPVIYAPYAWRNLAKFWKTLINENAKAPAFFNYFPGLGHNEICQFGDRHMRLFPIILRGSDDSDEAINDINAAIATLDGMEYNYRIIDISAGTSVLEKVLNNYILALWTSFYLANNLGVKAVDTLLIDKFKEHKKR